MDKWIAGLDELNKRHKSYLDTLKPFNELKYYCHTSKLKNGSEGLGFRRMDLPQNIKDDIIALYDSLH